MANPDTDEKKAFREQYKQDILNNPVKYLDEFLSVAEDATNSPDPVIAMKGWERIREIMLLKALASGGSDATALDAINGKIDAADASIEALNKSHGEDYQTLNEKVNALDNRVKSLETPLEPNPAPAS